jgi:autotransporter-associated beta strand protein
MLHPFVRAARSCARNLVTAAFALVLLASPAFAATVTWTGAVDSTWSNAGNWDTAQAPQTGDDVVLTSSGSVPNIYDLAGTVQLHSITATSPVVVGIGGGTIALQSAGSISNSSGNSLNFDNVFALNGPVTLGGSDDVVFNPSAQITGIGGVSIVTSGIVVFLAANTYSGDTTVAGTLAVVANAIPSGSAVTVNGQLVVGGSSTIGSLAGAGTVTANTDPVSLTLGGDNTSTVFSGVVQNGTAFPTPTVSLIKTGSGTFTLSGTNTYTGATTVNAGRLDVTGSIVSATTVNSGATLGGTGSINNSVTVNAGGTLAPGVSAGVLSTGNLTFAATSTLAVELNGTTAGTQYDQVQVTGAANLGSAAVNVSLGYPAAVNDAFTILTSTGTVSGTFGSITTPAGYSVSATYLADSIVLTVTGVPTVPGAPTVGTATAGDAQISVAFTPPASDGGSAILDYTATCGAQSATGTSPPIVVTGLANGTAYTCTVVARNAVGTGPASAASNSATPTAAATTSFSGPSATGSGTITASFTGGGATCAFSAPQFIGAPPGSPPVPPTLPAPLTTFPHGMFDFSAVGCTAGSTLSFTITYPVALPPGTQYWKYGPTASDPTPHWYVLPASITGNTATFTITDGGLGDDDLAANGTVVDQGGPGVGPTTAAAPIPTLGEWALILMSLLLLSSGAWAARRGRLPR